MRKRIFIMLFVLIMLFALSSCSSQMNHSPGDSPPQNESSPSIAPQVILNKSNRRIVYTVGIELITDNFQATLNKFNAAITEDVEAENWIKESSIDDNDTYKLATFVLRIKTTSLNEFLAKLPEMGKVSSQTQTSKDITYSYAQTEAEIAALTEERDYITSLIDSDNPSLARQYISQITELNRQLARLEDEQTKNDNELDYSTVNVNIRYSQNQVPTEQPFSKKIIIALGFVWTVLKGILIGIIYVFPFALIIGVVAFAVTFIDKKLKVRKKGKAYSDKVKEQMTIDKVKEQMTIDKNKDLLSDD